MRLSNLKTGAIALAAVAALAAPALAQQAPKYRAIVTYKVKADRYGDFQAAVKEQAALLKESHSDRGRTFWAAQSGPREYVAVRYFNTLAELDTRPDPALKDRQAAAARIGDRIMQCTESMSRTIEALQPDLSLSGTPEIPKMVRVIRTVVKPERVADYTALFAAEIVPAAKKAGVQTYSTGRTRFGGPSSEFRSAMGISSWAEMDSPPPVQKAMGDEAFKKFQEKLATMVVESDFNVYGYMPELSYVPESNVSTADRAK